MAAPSTDRESHAEPRKPAKTARPGGPRRARAAKSLTASVKRAAVSVLALGRPPEGDDAAPERSRESHCEPELPRDRASKGGPVLIGQVLKLGTQEQRPD